MIQSELFVKKWRSFLKDTLIIIPCYNEAPNLAILLPELTKLFSPDNILIIDDDSQDATATTARQFHVQVINNHQNLGIPQTVAQGLKYALNRHYQYLVRIDGDGQHPPAQIPKLLSPLYLQTTDIAIGSRLKKPSGYHIPFERQLVIQLLSKVITLITGKKIKDPTSGFIAINRKTLTWLLTQNSSHVYEPVQLVQLIQSGFRIKEIAVDMHPRIYGKSTISLLKGIQITATILFQLGKLRFTSQR